MDNSQKTKRRSYINIILAGVLWGVIGLFLNILLDAGFTRLQVTLIRMGTAAAGLAVYTFAKDRKLFKIKLRDLWCFLGTGLVSVLLMNIFYFRAIESTGLSVAAVLLYTSPVFVTLMSALFFKEKLTAKKLVALPVTVLGCVLVTGLAGGASVCASVPGILSGIASAITYALYSIFGRCALNRGYSPVTVSLYTFIFSALGALPLVLLEGAAFPSVLIPSSALASLGIGIVSCLLPFLFYTKGLSNIETGKASIIVTVEPLTATVAGAIAYCEPFTAAKIAGMVLIFASIALLSVEKKKNLYKGGNIYA